VAPIREDRLGLRADAEVWDAFAAKNGAISRSSSKESARRGAVKRWAAAQSGFEAAFGPERAAELRRLPGTVVAHDFEATAWVAQARPH
jgi:hypothetical protein